MAPRDLGSGRGGHGCRPAGTAGLSLRALVSVVGSAVQAGLSLRSRAAGVDQPAGRNSPSGCGAAGFEQMACLESASGPRAAWMDQPCRRDSASWRGPGGGSTSRPGGTCAPGAVAAGVTRWPGGTQPPGAGHGCRPAGTAGLSLRALVSVVGSAVQAGLSLKARAGGVDQPARRDLCSGRGGRGGGPAGPAGLVLRVRWSRGSSRCPGGTWALGAGPACVD